MNRLVFRSGRGADSLEAALDVVPHPTWERIDRFDDGSVSMVVATYPTHTADHGKPGLSIDDEWVVGVDGHVHRSAELAARLGLSDASTVDFVHAAVRRYGEHAAAQLEGDFALVAHHRPSRRTVVAVDRFGSRQLHTSALSGTLAVASEPLSALRAVGRRFEPDVAVTAQMLVGRAITRERSLYRGAATMAAGTTRVFHEDGTSTDHGFFRPEPMEPCASSLRAAIDLGVDALARAVRARCEGCSRVGVLVSGGLDSTIVAALARRACRELGLPRPTLFHVSAEGFAADERPYAQRVADTLGLELVVRDVVQTVPVRENGLVELHGLTTPAFVRLFEAATAMGVRVMLSGEGGDELQFPTGREVDDLFAAKEWVAAAKFLLFGRGTTRARLQNAARAGIQPWLPRALLAERAIARDAFSLPSWLTPLGRRYVGDAVVEQSSRELEVEHPLQHKSTIASHYAWSSAMTASYQLQNALGARAGVELRHPFFDENVYELFASLPTSLLMSPHMEKPLLRAVCARLLPSSLSYGAPYTDYTPVHRALWGPHIRSGHVPDLESLGIVTSRTLADDLRSEEPSFAAYNALLAQRWLANLARLRG